MIKDLYPQIKNFYLQRLEQDPDLAEYLQEYMPTIFKHLALNYRRLGDLHHLAAEKAPAEKKPPSQHDTHSPLYEEISRAIIILMHAVLEDTLREIIRPILSKCSVEILNEIPLTGISLTGRPQKFSLGELSKHRGKTINELIQESTNEFLNRRSFNSSSDIADTLKMIGIKTSHLEKHFAPLQEMIARRHQIVHRADRENVPGSSELTPINIYDLAKWATATSAFLIDLSMEILISQADPDKQTSLRSFLQKTPVINELKQHISDLSKHSHPSR